MVTHDAAIALALNVLGDQRVKEDEKAMEAAIRAYLDARGLVMVPKRATDAMQERGMTGLSDNGLGDVDWSDARECYKAMLAAAPDPFGDAP